jgi:poly-gamma-glutamate synthesis protein (capsule biosynthesis protein)
VFCRAFAGVATALLLGACTVTTTAMPSATQTSAPTRGASSTPTPPPTPTPVPALSLSRLFHPPGPVAADPTRVRTLIATGDVIPARLVNIEATKRQDFVYPFRPTAEYVRNADLTYINLESPLLAGCPARSTGLTFCSDTRFIEGITAIGARVVNLANNHVNAGPDTQATAALLQQRGIQAVTDLGPPALADVKGLKFAFLGVNGVTSGPRVDREALRTGIQHARTLADVVVVQFHWGKEYERQPMPAPAVAPDNPIELGHVAIDAGADVVIGNHPHWVQGVEIYKSHLIAYAHGNYVFDQVNCYPAIGSDYRTYCSDDTRTSVVATYTFVDKQLAGVTWRPTFIDTTLQTQWAEPGRAATVLKTMEDASVELARAQGEPTS